MILTVDEAADLLKVREDEETGHGFVRVLTWHTADDPDRQQPTGCFWKVERVFEIWQAHGVFLLPLGQADPYFCCVLETTVYEITIHRVAVDWNRVRWFLGGRPCQHPARINHGRHEWYIGGPIRDGLQICRACGALAEAGPFDRNALPQPGEWWQFSSVVENGVWVWDDPVQIDESGRFPKCNRRRVPPPGDL